MSRWLDAVVSAALARSAIDLATSELLDVSVPPIDGEKGGGG
jgi:hypothetical protein